MKNLPKDYVILALVIIGSLIAYLVFSPSHDATKPTSGSTSTPQVSEVPRESRTSSQPETGASYSMSSPNSTNVPSSFGDVPLATIQQAKETVNRFTNVAAVEMQLPEGMPFKELDLDDNQMAGIYARSHNMAMAVVAARMNPSLDDIKKFVSSKDTGIPNLDRGISALAEPIRVPPVPGNGIREGYLWIAKTATGEDLRIGVMPREDGQGSYMVVISAPQGTIDNNENYFEGLYKTFRAKPAPK